MSELKVGIIGLGMGLHHLKQFNQSPHARVVAIADPEEARLLEVGEANNVDARYTDGEEMIAQESLDIVAVATPNKFHRPLTLAALEAGCHVLCEKPMAMHADEAEEMLAAAKAADRRLMINFSYRFNPQSQLIKREVESGALGDIYHAESTWLRRRGLPRFGGWFGQKALSGGGPLIDLGVHRLDFVLWLMDYPQPTWVMAGTADPIGSRLASEQGKDFDVEDFATAMITFENGATVQLTVSWATYVRESELIRARLLGTKGGALQVNLNEGYDFQTEFYSERHGCQLITTPHGNMPGPGSAMAHLADSIVNDKPHSATGEEGLIVMRILDAIYESAEKGCPVQI